MNELKNINSALVTAYLAVGLNLPTAYEVKDFPPPASGPWARVTNFPAVKAVRTLGSSGEDSYTGFYQIDFFVPENTGTKNILEYADATLNYFKNGRRFVYGGQEVLVRRSSLSQIRRDSSMASFYITLSVYWDSRSAR